MSHSEYSILLATKDDLEKLPGIQLKAAQRFPVDVLPEPMRSSYTFAVENIEESQNNSNLWVAKFCRLPLLLKKHAQNYRPTIFRNFLSRLNNSRSLFNPLADISFKPSKRGS